jgi:hypothetical protein
MVEPASGQPLEPSAAPGASTQPGGQGSTGGETWMLADRIYYEPLLAEQRAARIFLLFPGWSQKFPHSQDGSDRFAWQVALGREIPIVGWQSERVGLARFSRGKWGVGLWIPISFHMIEDFKDESNPIVDTDYRFGMMAKFQVGLTERSWLSVRFVPWAHESTHLGDEYTILAAAQPDFERINVSYEYREYGISYEWSLGNRSLLTVRHGGISLWGDDGYYSNHLLGSTTPTLSPSGKNYEPSFGVEYRLPRSGTTGRQLIASVDFRSRLQYSFHHPASGEERRRPTWTIAVGRTAVEGDRTFLRSYFGYFTRGVNPFGQLREQYPYWAAGIGWVFQ